MRITNKNLKWERENVICQILKEVLELENMYDLLAEEAISVIYLKITSTKEKTTQTKKQLSILLMLKTLMMVMMIIVILIILIRVLI